jgi:hypothetical protein
MDKRSPQGSVPASMLNQIPADSGIPRFCQISSHSRNPPMTCKLWLGTAFGAERRITPFPVNASTTLRRGMTGPRMDQRCAGRTAAPPATRERPTVPPRAKSFWRSFPNPSRAGPQGHRNWFMPACAGNAYGPCSSRWAIAVHPRMRGERLILAKGKSPSAGSSPHARGTLHVRVLWFRIYRFIPACAGNAAVAPQASRL